MKISVQVRAYLKDHPDAIIEDVAELFGCHMNQVRGYYRELGIKPTTRKQVAGRDWLTERDSKEADQRLNELMQNPKVIKWLNENDFSI